MALVGEGVGTTGDGVGVVRPGTGAAELVEERVTRGVGAGGGVQLAKPRPSTTSEHKNTRRGDFPCLIILATIVYLAGDDTGFQLRYSLSLSFRLHRCQARLIAFQQFPLTYDEIWG